MSRLNRHTGSVSIFLGAVFLIAALSASGSLAAKPADEPFDPIASLYEKGNDYFRKGSYSSAISVFQLIPDNHPDHALAPEAMFSIASAQHKMGDRAAALTTYQELLRRYPTAPAIPDALLQMGTISAEMGDPAAAKSSWTKLITEYKGSISAKIAEQRLSSVQVATSPTPLAPERPAATPPPSHMKESAVQTQSAVEMPGKMPPMPSPAESVQPGGTDEWNAPAVSMPPSMPSEPARAEATYVVKKNDSVSGIAQKLLGSRDRYKELARFNKIPPPYTLNVGQILRIPGKAASRPAEPSVASAGAYEPMFSEEEMSKKKGKKVSPMPTAFPANPPGTSTQAAPAWEPTPVEDMEKAAGSIEKWVDDRNEGYEALQQRLLELQHDAKTQKLMEKQLEILKSQLEGEQNQNNDLKKEIISHVERLKEMKDRNMSLTSQIQSLTDAMDRSKAIQARNAEMDAQMKSNQQKMGTLEKQNQTLSETLQKMRDAFDAQMALVKAYYDSQLESARQDYEIRMDTTEAELSRLRAEARQKDASLNEIKRDYTDLIKKTESIQKEMIQEKQKSVSTTAAKESYDKAKDLKRQGKTREAEAAFREALSVYPDYADAMNELAFLYAEDGRDLDDAEKLVDKAISVDPDGRGYYLDTLGWILYSRHAYTAALDSLLEAHKLVPVDNLPARAAVQFHLGKVYEAVSDKDKAFFYFIDAIKLAPRTRWATLAERELDSL